MVFNTEKLKYPNKGHTHELLTLNINLENSMKSDSCVLGGREDSPSQTVVDHKEWEFKLHMITEF